MNAEAVKALVMAAIAALIFAAGWAVEGWRKDAEIADLKSVQAKQVSNAAEENTKKLADAQQLSDSLLLQLSGWQATLNEFAKEKTHEIDRLATGRRCLDSALVRVLNRPTDIKLSGAVPTAASIALRADAPIGRDPDDGQFATDIDVSKWANQCRLKYDACRLDRNAIAKFYEGKK